MHAKNLKRTARRPLLAGLLVAAFVAGCGDDSNSADVPSSPTAAAPTAAAQTPAATDTGKSGKGKGKGSKGGAESTPAPSGTPAPIKGEEPASITVTGSRITVKPNPLPAGKNLTMITKGTGLGKNAYLAIFDADGNNLGSIVLKPRKVKVDFPAFKTGELEFKVMGSDKVNPSSVKIPVR